MKAAVVIKSEEKSLLIRIDFIVSCNRCDMQKNYFSIYKLFNLMGTLKSPHHETNKLSFVFLCLQNIKTQFPFGGSIFYVLLIIFAGYLRFQQLRQYKPGRSNGGGSPNADLAVKQ
jgi:hypothetical protein